MILQKQTNKQKLFQERGMYPGQTKAIDVHPRGIPVLQLKGFLEIIVFPESHTVKGGGGMEISQVPTCL